MSARAHIAHRLGAPILGGAGQTIGRMCECGAPLSLAVMRAERVAPVEWACSGCPKRETLPRWRAEARDYCGRPCRKRARRREDHRERCEGCATCAKWGEVGT